MVEHSDNHDGFKATLAVGIIAGILVLLQYWNTYHASIFPWRSSDPWNISPIIGYLVIAVLILFTFYISFMVLATGFEPYQKLKRSCQFLKNLANGLFLAGGLFIIPTAIFVFLRLLGL